MDGVHAPEKISRLDAVYGRLPLSIVSWLYNLRRTGHMLLPGNRYPLADQANTLSCQPLLFVSAGRSGTTLLRSMLVTSGQIAIPPEAFAIPYAALQYQAMQEQSWYNLTRIVLSLFEAPSYFDSWEINMHPVYAQGRSLPAAERSLARLIDLVYQHYAQTHFPEAHIWGDQSIENARRLGWIMAIYPKARYIHILRDGRDVVASYVEVGRGFEWAMHRWQSSVEAALRAKQQLPSAHYLEIRYEDLTEQPEQVLQRVCDFAQIAYDDKMLSYWQAASTETERDIHRNLNRPIFKSSVGRWRERLSPQQCARLESHLGPLLHKLDYA